MRKIPTLFKRDSENPRIVTREYNVEPNQLWIATRKWDGSAMLCGINGWYRRYDAKHGKAHPGDFVPAQESPDPITGHWPGWVPVREGDPASKWHVLAIKNTPGPFTDGATYEAVGPHFQGNRDHFEKDQVIEHGLDVIMGVRLDYDGLMSDLLHRLEIEGIVFWLDGEPVCKIKRTDFGLAR